MLARQLLLNLVVTFSLFSGSYVLGGVKLYPPLFLAILGFSHSIFLGKIPPIMAREFIWWHIFSMMFIVSYFLGQNDESFFVLSRYIIKAIIIPLGCCLLVKVVSSKITNRSNAESIKQAVFFALLIQLLITLLQLSFPSFRGYFNSVIELTGEWKTLSDAGHFRATGLSGLSIYDMSISYGIIYLLFLPWCLSEKLWLNFKFLFVTLIVIILTLIAGRSGFLFVLFILIYSLVISSKWVFYLVNILICLLVCVVILISLIGVEQLYFFSQFVFEPVYNYLDSGKFESASTNELMDSYLFIPWDVPPLTGMGVWAQPSIASIQNFKYMTDSGFILSYIAFGFFGILFFIAYSIRFTIKCVNGVEKSGFFMGILFFVVFLMLVFSFFLKGPVFLSERVMAAYFLLLLHHEFFRLSSRSI